MLCAFSAVIIGLVGNAVLSGVKLQRNLDAAVDDVLGVEVEKGSAKYDFVSGRVSVRNVDIHNPKGFVTEYAVERVDSVLLRLRESGVENFLSFDYIEVDGGLVLPEFDLRLRNNLKVILRNIVNSKRPLNIRELIWRDGKISVPILPNAEPVLCKFNLVGRNIKANTDWLASDFDYSPATWSIFIELGDSAGTLNIRGRTQLMRKGESAVWKIRARNISLAESGLKPFFGNAGLDLRKGRLSADFNISVGDEGETSGLAVVVVEGLDVSSVGSGEGFFFGVRSSALASYAKKHSGRVVLRFPLGVDWTATKKNIQRAIVALFDAEQAGILKRLRIK